ncbi:PA14 domain-containing protein [Planctomycetota bacterium]
MQFVANVGVLAGVVVCLGLAGVPGGAPRVAASDTPVVPNVTPDGEVAVLLSIQLAVAEHGAETLRGGAAVPKLLELLGAQEAWVHEEALRLLSAIAGRAFREAAEAEAFWDEAHGAELTLERALAAEQLESGAAAIFYPNLDLAGPGMAEVRPSIYCQEGGAPVAGGGREFSSRWIARLCVPAAGDYELRAWVDDGARVWIDGRLVLDEWAYRGEYRSIGRLHLTEGLHTVYVEHYDSGGPAALVFEWRQGKAAEFVRVPWTLFRTGPGAAQALQRVVDAWGRVPEQLLGP